MFDQSRADRVCSFFKDYLVHTKGKWNDQPFAPLKWQREHVLDPLFGTLKPNGNRQYSRAHIEVPKKNGKSTLAAGLALYLLFADDEPGAEVYSVAGDRPQAKIVFGQAAEMVRRSPDLSARANVLQNSIVVPRTGSVYQCLSADEGGKHGLNASGVIFDELHVQKKRDLYDALRGSITAREQPLFVQITTAGYDRKSICWEQHEYARRVIEGVIKDPSYFAFIAAADEDDDWTKVATWRKSNPSYGVTISAEYMRTECNAARKTPAYQNTFRRLHLNQWTQQDSRWLDVRKWNATAGVVDVESLKGEVCYGGLDLASNIDITAFVLVFPRDDGTYHVVCRFWIPADDIVERSHNDGVPYDAWARDGWIETTPGNVIDYDYIRSDIIESSEKYDLQEVGFDRWGAQELSQSLNTAGVTVIPVGQGMVSMAPPTKELLTLILQKRLIHGGNPVLNWMADNIVVQQDAAGNVKPNKAESSAKIDGMVALIMAIDRAVRNTEDQSSVYETRGVVCA